MLILTRRAGELVRIGKNMSVQVLSVEGGHVRLGITAPPEVPVHREEVFMRILRESTRQGPQRKT